MSERRDGRSNLPQESESKGFERVSHTALSMAFQRTVSDIPYSKAIYKELLKNASTGEAQKQRNPSIAPYYEARHRIISHLLTESNVPQVLEIAAGFTPRGLELTEDPNFTVIEVDLPGNANLKRTVVDTFVKDFRPNLHILSGDALDLASLEKAAEHLDPSMPTGIVTEGLLRYFNHKEKGEVATNIHTILEKSGGVWIAPGIPLRENESNADPVSHTIIQNSIKRTGINTYDNMFGSVEEATKLFNKYGFTVEDHPLTEIIDELISPKILGHDATYTQSWLGKSHVFVMRPR